MARLGRFAKEIKRLRLAKGYTQREWGPLLGVHWITAQRWEMGRYHPWNVGDRVETEASRRMKRAVENAILDQARALEDHPKKLQRQERRRKPSQR